MPKIDIDDEVYEHLQRNAIPFEDHEPNDTIRRLLFGQGSPGQVTELGRNTLAVSKATANLGKKGPKANLPELVNAGLLAEGQLLFLIDYRGKRLSHNEAKIDGRKLLIDGINFSMSSLAKNLLQHHGYTSDSVRGPAHWVTENGESIMDIWQRYLND